MRYHLKVSGLLQNPLYVKTHVGLLGHIGSIAFEKLWVILSLNFRFSTRQGIRGKKERKQSLAEKSLGLESILSWMCSHLFPISRRQKPLALGLLVLDHKPLATWPSKRQVQKCILFRNSDSDLTSLWSIDSILTGQGIDQVRCCQTHVMNLVMDSRTMLHLQWL